MVEIPKEMKRLVVISPGAGTSVADCKMEIETVPTPIPKSNEVLIKVAAAPINPSDYGSWYKSKPESYPMAVGKEGSGTIVATGGYLTSLRFSVGMNVGFICNGGNTGSYSEYVAINAMTGVFPMPEDVPIEDCASFMVNPYTAVGILDTAKQSSSSKAIVHTAAASQLGQMLNKLAIMEDMQIINVVRREEQKQLLEELGAKHIVVTSSSSAGDGDDAWKDELKAKVKELGATCAFDAVSGDMTGHLLDVMPAKTGVVYLYGNLAGRAGNIDPSNLIYRKKQLKSFFLTSWIQNGGTMQMVSRMMNAGKIVNSGLGTGGWCSTQFQDVEMLNAHEEICKALNSSITGKKLRIRFD